MATSFDTLISSIANLEAGLAGLTNVEISKQSQLLELADNVKDIGYMNDQLARFLRLLIKKEIVLELLLDEIIEMQQIPEV